MSQGAVEQPNREGLIPELQALVDELDPIGWCPDNPSEECRRVLTPPQYVRWFDGLDRLVLCWWWVRIHVEARLSTGGHNKITSARRVFYDQVAYMHVASWVAEACGHPADLSLADHVELEFSIKRWHVEQAVPKSAEFLDACIQSGEMVYGSRYRFGFAVCLLSLDSGVIPLGQHMSALLAAFKKHHSKKGLPPEDAEKAARAELGSDTLAAHAWIEALGDAASLGYFKDGRYLLASWGVERQLQKLFGARGKSVKGQGQPIDDEQNEPAQPQSPSPLGPPDEPHSLLLEVLRIVGLTDLDLDSPDSIASLGSLIAEAAPKTSDPALHAAKICRLFPDSVRAKVARVFGVSESAVRHAGKRL